MTTLTEILTAALSLKTRERAALAQELLASLDELSEEETDRFWAEEAERRMEAYRAGRARVTDAETAHSSVRQLSK